MNAFEQLLTLYRRYDNMHGIGLLVSNTRLVLVLLIASLFAAAAFAALSPPAVLGQANDSPATMEECKEELAAGRAVLCSSNSFSVITTMADGTYHINWSEWANRQSNVERYTIQRLRFVYRYNFQLEADGTAVNDWEHTALDVNSCRPWGVERDNTGVVTRWAWFCNGISNVREDPSGTPTSIERLDDDWTSTSWTGSLLAPGRKHNVQVQALRIPGSKTEAHPDNPQSATDRLTQQEVDDNTHNLLASEVEMHLYVITARFGDGATRRSHGLITGSPFADRQ